ncbi:MAG: Hsp20/alpha crystallin family protein [Spirochaetia bacterium]|nr:Hsp20/alpha crystallin family protein [Spirochaetia bacterium]
MELFKRKTTEPKAKEEKKEAMTHQTRYYTPPADIFENDESITLELEVPGVSKDQVSISLEKGVLEIDGKIDPKRYDGFVPLYTEYGVGHYFRRFEVSDAIASDKISASMQDGVLTIVLPRAEAAKPRKIEIA